jgi:GntR family transcriptional repressor for pyruvate dehydrogenase complex
VAGATLKRSDEARRQILSLIHDGKLAPGAKLPSERRLAETVGVSRPILREALHALETMGYIDRREKSGSYLCTAVPSDLRARIEKADPRLLPFSEVIEVRKVLETWAAERAAEAPERADVDELRSCVRAMVRHSALRDAEEFARYREADLAFHQVLARMSGNVLFIHLFGFLADLVRRSITLSKRLVRSHFAEENLARHRAVLDAIERRDPAAARAAMQAHFALVERQVAR